MPKLICMSHGMHHSANLSILALTESVLGCQDSSWHVCSLLTAFSIFLGLFCVKPIILIIFSTYLAKNLMYFSEDFRPENELIFNGFYPRN